MYIYICVCVHICMYIYVCMYVNVYIYMCEYIYKSASSALKLSTVKSELIYMQEYMYI